MKDTRLLTFDQYLEIIDGIRDQDETLYFMIGTHAPRRDWGDMVHEYAQINGLHGLRQLADDPDPVDLDEDHATTPHKYLDDPEIVARDAGKWIGDAVYPRFGFADPDSTTDLESADRTLLATTYYREADVDTRHPLVFDADQFENAVRDVLEQYDADEHAVFIGAFAPTGTYSIGNEGPFVRAGDAVYPTTGFADTTGMSSLESAKTLLYGSIVITRDALSSDAVRMLEDDDVDAIGGEDPDQADADGVEA